MISRLRGGAEFEFECIFPRGEWSDKRNIKTEVVKGHSVAELVLSRHTGLTLVVMLAGGWNNFN